MYEELMECIEEKNGPEGGENRQFDIELNTDFQNCQQLFHK